MSIKCLFSTPGPAGGLLPGVQSRHCWHRHVSDI